MQHSKQTLQHGKENVLQSFVNKQKEIDLKNEMTTIQELLHV